MSGAESKDEMPHPDDVMLCTCGDPEYSGCYRHNPAGMYPSHSAASSSPDEIPADVAETITAHRDALKLDGIKTANGYAIRWLADAFERAVRERNEAVTDAERLRTDSERLDWIEMQGGLGKICWWADDNFTFRNAIDAARAKEEVTNGH